MGGGWFCRDTHLGHALNKILKSIIVQYQILRGARPRYVPGWDCHGLPIELKVLQGLSPEQRKELTPISLRRKARDFALKTMKAQRDQFRRYPLPRPPPGPAPCDRWIPPSLLIPPPAGPWRCTSPPWFSVVYEHLSSLVLPSLW